MEEHKNELNNVEIPNDIVTKKKNSNKLIILSLIFIFLIVGIFTWYLVNKDKKEQSNSNKVQENNTKIENNDNKKEQITPLMYEVTKEGSNNKIYLFGSMHMVNLEEFDFPKYVRDAYNNSKYLACEFDVVEYTKNMDAIKEAESFLYKDGTTIKDHISEESYNKIVEFLQKNYFYNEALDTYNLYFFESLITQVILQNSTIGKGTSVDEYFLNKAKEDNKNILEVESYEFQINLLSNFPDRFYELSIIDSIDNYEEQVKELGELYETWKTGDVEKIIEEEYNIEVYEDKYTKEEIKMFEDYNNNLLGKRNIGMTDKLITYFDNNYDTFYMVGVAHLVGDKGIAHLLEEKGYKVTRITN